MKNIFLTIITLTGLFSFVNAQAYINVKSTVPDEETSWFVLYVNEEAQDAFPYDEMEAEDLDPGSYEIHLNFNSDTIADIFFKVNLAKGDSLYYEVVPLKEFSREARKAGRGFGRLFDENRNIRMRDGYVEAYRLRKVTKDK